jgi:hypothetical protein
MDASHESHAQQSLTDAAERWLLKTREKRLQLHMQAAQPLYFARDEAFREMSTLLQEAMEEVRILTAALREASQTAPPPAAPLQARAAAAKGHSR